jgi:3-carboxy-cis,cis-muconate cycloisomerase
VIFGAMAQEHERAAGGWQAEWAAIPELFRATAGAVAHAAQMLDGLQVDADRMRANLERGGGLAMAEALTIALAPQLGRPEAQRLVQDLARRAQTSGVTLREAAQDDPQVGTILSPDQIARALDPASYLGATHDLIDRALAGYRALG